MKKFTGKFILIIVLIFFTIFFIFPYIFPNFIVNKSCRTDADCALKDIDCDTCDCLGEAVNKNWNKICPLGEISLTCFCAPMPSYLDFKAVCNKGVCERIKVPNCLGICKAPEDFLKSVDWEETFNKSLEEILKECNCI
jgi:hypothetical protein